jgi:uncharacterized protein with von Willebrand factor type A (vWA) domain
MPTTFAVFLDRMLSTPVLWKLAQKTVFVEQPIRRDAALQRDVSALGKRIALAHRRVRRHARRLRAGARAGLHGRVEQELQGLLQVCRQRGALRALECRPKAVRAISSPAKT